MSRILKSKANIRNQIIFALAHGTDRRAKRDTGIVEKLLKRVSQTLDVDPNVPMDPDVLTKLIQGVVRLSAIAMPTAYQAEALEKGLAPGAGSQVNPTDIIALLTEHLEARRKLLNPIQVNSIDVTPKSSNIKDLARIELDKRLTPPPVPPPGRVAGESGGRAPTHPKIVPQEQLSGTNKVSLNLKDLKDDPLPELDI